MLKCKLREWFEAWLSREERIDDIEPCSLCGIQKECPYNEIKYEEE